MSETTNIGQRRALDLSTQLADKEAKEVSDKMEEHKDKISRVAKEVEAILIKEDCTWNDWNEVVQKFNDRNGYVIPRITMKEIGERFEAETNPQQ